MMKKYSLTVIVFLLIGSSGTNLANEECVVLLHGFARVSNSMGELETKLGKAGYDIANIRYSSRSHTIEVLALDAVGRGITQCEATDPAKIHFVTHSLGGILLRYYVQESSLSRLGRVVMLGPPNQGSEIVDRLLPFPGFGFIIGPTGVLLGAEEGSILHELGPVEFDLGIIAGKQSINPFSALFFGTPNDSIVSVESTKVEGMNAHRVLPVTHTFMMRNNEVIDEAIHYLKTGAFIPLEIDQ